MRSVTLFAGPSAYGVPRASLLRDGTCLRPPIRRGDIDRLIASTDGPGVAVICDGLFHSEPAVSHAEICRALDDGWAVWGVSSMGAIRAFEMRAEGMRGFGYVHSMFDRFDDFTDDEMCLLHFPEEPYFPLSEPLVNVRFALEQRKTALGISDASESKLLSMLRDLWFGDRTEERIRGELFPQAGIDKASGEALITWFTQQRVKTLDLVDLMAARPWMD